MIRDQILDGAFAAGARISEPLVAQRLGVSRGPVREALQRLVQEGILLNIPNKGVCVVDLGVDDIQDIYAARCPLEKEAATHLFYSKDAKNISSLRTIISKMEIAVAKADWKKVIESDLAFHTQLVACMGSKRIDRMFSTLRAETYLCLKNLVNYYRDLTDLVLEHREILDLIEGDDLEKLLESVTRHFDSALLSMAPKA